MAPTRCPFATTRVVSAAAPFASSFEEAQSSGCTDNLISYYFDMDKLQVDEVGEEVFKKQLWQCMISQALELKGDIETRRAGNTFGIIVWQYNE